MCVKNHSKLMKSQKLLSVKDVHIPLSATPMQFDKDGVCMGCIVSDAKLSQSKSHYEFLEKKLKNIIKNSKNSSNYDCIISVSGGKDSYYQTHYVTKVLGLKALLVTYNGNNYSDVGWRNLWKMKESFPL